MENQTEIKIGAFYHIYSKNGDKSLIRPLSETSKFIEVYFVDSESITYLYKPLKNKLEFTKDTIREELKQFRKNVNAIYKDRFGHLFFGKFYLDSDEESIERKKTQTLISTIGDVKEAKKTIKHDLSMLKESKILMGKRYKEVVSALNSSEIESEKDNLKKQLLQIRSDKKDIKEKMNHLVCRLKEL